MYFFYIPLSWYDGKFKMNKLYEYLWYVIKKRFVFKSMLSIKIMSWCLKCNLYFATRRLFENITVKQRIKLVWMVIFIVQQSRRTQISQIKNTSEISKDVPICLLESMSTHIPFSYALLLFLENMNSDKRIPA